MRIKIIDLNQELIAIAISKGYDAVCADYFREVYKTEKPVMITASNPYWTFGGGIDALFAKYYTHLVQYKQSRGGEMERISNIIFAITVDKNLKATKEQLERVLDFAQKNVGKEETLCLSGIGTGIGGMSLEDWFEVISTIK